MAQEVAVFEKIIPNNQGWDVLWQVSLTQSVILDPGHCLWGFQKMEEKMKKGIHLIVRLIDLKNTRGCPFLLSKRASVPPGKQKGNRCRTTGVVLRVTKNNPRLCLKT